MMRRRKKYRAALYRQFEETEFILHIHWHISNLLRFKKGIRAEIRVSEKSR
jgi:hypothetical protein